MTWKKIWNAIQTDDLREKLWNELTDEEKIALYLEHNKHQINRFYGKLTPVLRDQADKYWAEVIRCQKLEKYLWSYAKSEYDRLISPGREILNWYVTAFAHVLIFEKCVIKPLKIIDLELKYFWKENESLEKQKKDWDRKFSWFTKDEELPDTTTPNDISGLIQDRFGFGFDENEQEHNS